MNNFKLGRGYNTKIISQYGLSIILYHIDETTIRIEIKYEGFNRVATDIVSIKDNLTFTHYIVWAEYVMEELNYDNINMDSIFELQDKIIDSLMS
jgi:hypothetical protein